MIQVLVGIGIVILAIGLFTYNAIKTKKELGEWKDDKARKRKNC